MACLGEGEEALVELATKMENGQDFYDVPGIWFKENGKIIKNAMRPLIQNLDTIPLPDNDYANKYLLCGRHILPMNDDLLMKYSARKKKTYKTLPTRGCLFECTYCCHSAYKKLYPNQNYIRKRSIDNVIKELMEVKNADRIKLCDDHFFSYNEEEIEDFCRKYKNSINLPLMVIGISPTTFNRKKMTLLVDAGLVYLKVGIQTGSKNTKKLYKRSHSNKRIIHVAKEIHEFGSIEVSYDIIIDNPWESDEDLIETLMLLTKLPVPYKLNLFSLKFYPGTALYEMAKSKGMKEDELIENCNVDFFDVNKNTYLNKLFVLMQMHAKKGKVLSPKRMSLLTSRRLRRLKLHWLLYGITKMKLIVKSGILIKTIKKRYKKKKRKPLLKTA
jgi:anaerobic magnesium-protoporphyrin IX monomethyl ester cyclase